MTDHQHTADAYDARSSAVSIDTILHPGHATGQELKRLDAQIAYIDILLANLGIRPDGRENCAIGQPRVEPVAKAVP